MEELPVIRPESLHTFTHTGRNRCGHPSRWQPATACKDRPAISVSPVIPMRRSMLVGSIRRILHDANVHRLSNRYSNRLSCVVIDEAQRTFEEDIVRVLEDIELAKRLKRLVAWSLHLDGELISPAPR